MASAAEQLAANLNFGAFAKATELQKRIWYTLGALIVYRIGTHIPIPGIDPEAYARAFQSQQAGILGMFNMLSGGAVERMAVFALNVMPYISASIIVQILTHIVPSLEKLKKEGEAGRKQINQYTRWLAVALAVVQSLSIAYGLQSGTNPAAQNPGPIFVLSTVATLTGGTMFLMWIGERVTARGVGNGSSLIIFTGIVAEMPRAIGRSLVLASQEGKGIWGLLIVGVIAIAVIFFIVFMERSQRRLLIQYPKRQVGNRVFQGDTSFLPLKINPSGVIPPIFASTFLLMPATVASFAAVPTDGGASNWFQSALRDVAALLGHGQPMYMLTYAGLIIFFAFFYTSIVFNPVETADNLRKHNGFVPGFRPGKKTAEYIDKVLTRLVAIGAVYLTFVCLLPEFLIAEFKTPFYLGGTSILIVVSVTMDTVTQIQSHLLAHQYEGLIKKSRLGKRGR